MRVLKWNVFGLAVLLLLLLPPSVVAQEPAPVTRENTVTYEQLLANREAVGEAGTDPQYVIVDLPQQSEVRIANVSYHERYGTMDTYYPPDFDFESRVPAVVFPNYYPDSQYKSGFGVTFRQSRLASDWTSLLAASGMAAIVYDTSQPHFSGRAALDCVAEHGGALRIDTGRLGVLAASADVQTAVQLLSKSNIDAVSGVQACVSPYPTTFSAYVPAGSPEVRPVHLREDHWPPRAPGTRLPSAAAFGSQVAGFVRTSHPVAPKPILSFGPGRSVFLTKIYLEADIQFDSMKFQ